MNLANKITFCRLVLAVVILLLLIFPWYQINIEWPVYFVFDMMTVNLMYIVAGVLFLIAALTDFLDGYVARSKNLVSDFGKFMDATADKILVNGLLIILAHHGFISIVIPVVVITRDIVVDGVRMIAGNTGRVVASSVAGKIKTIFMMSGITLVLFYNLPFELIGVNIADILLIIATLFSVISGCQYYLANKDLLFKDK